MKYRLLIVIAALTLVLSSCEHKKQEVDIARKWTMISYTSADNQTQSSEDSIGYLDFESSSHKFTLLKPDNSLVIGNWSKDSNTLYLTYNISVDGQIDSISLQTNNENVEMSYYQDSLLVATTSNNEMLQTVKVCDTVLITDVSETSLNLDYNGEQYAFIYRTTLKSGGGFSFMSLLRGILGIFVLMCIAFVFSTNRRKVNWKTVSMGLILQILIAVLVLKVGFVGDFFGLMGKGFVKILDFTKEGSVFVFGALAESDSLGHIFAFQVLPTIIFFSALMSILYYLGVIQKVVYWLSLALTKLLGLSGAESLSAAGNIFLGQTESPLLIKGYLKNMNKSELNLVMVGGMATIAGGVMAMYIAMLGGSDPVQKMIFAKHLLTASVMAAPGAVVVAKILVPNTEKVDTKVKMEKGNFGTNILDAITTGTGEGVKLAVNVGAMLIVFIALIAFANYIFAKVGMIGNMNGWIASHTAFDSLSLEFILGYITSPIMWCIGVEPGEMAQVGQLLGQKVILNEFVAYTSLTEMVASGSLSPKSQIIATYILCGFANFSSIGIQIGGIGALAPEKRTELTQLGMRALLGGTLASLVSATIVGVILG